MRDSKPGECELTIRLLPAEPAIARQPRGEDNRAGVVDFDLPGDAYEGASAPLSSLFQRRLQSG